VIPIPDEEADEIPKAFIVARGDVHGRRVDGFRRGKCRPLQRVRAIEFVDEIPKSPSGRFFAVSSSRHFTTGPATEDLSTYV